METEAPRGEGPCCGPPRGVSSGLRIGTQSSDFSIVRQGYQCMLTLPSPLSALETLCALAPAGLASGWSSGPKSTLNTSSLRPKALSFVAPEQSMRLFVNALWLFSTLQGPKWPSQISGIMTIYYFKDILLGYGLCLQSAGSSWSHQRKEALNGANGCGGIYPIRVSSQPQAYKEPCLFCRLAVFPWPLTQ